MFAIDTSSLHQQDSDFEIVKLLLPHIENHTFLDIGAEKGTFAQLLISHNFKGILFEPLPKHGPILKKLASESNCIFSDFAIDKNDGKAEFHIACDPSTGDSLDYFHSLHRLENDTRVQHQQSIQVTCRSLNSLCHEKFIDQCIGIIKTDTEGNDLHVLQGMTEIDAEMLVCEFFMSGVYSGWTQGNPLNLINQAKELGFSHYVTVKRMNFYEIISLDNPVFVEKQWGNLIFLKNHIFEKASSQLIELISKKESQFLETLIKHSEDQDFQIQILKKGCDERLELINLLDSELNKYKEKDKNKNKSIRQKLIDKIKN